MRATKAVVNARRKVQSKLHAIGRDFEEEEEVEEMEEGEWE